MRKTRSLEGETPNPKSYAYSKWNIKLNSSQWRYSWLSGCQSLPVQTPHCGKIITTTLQKAGVPGKDDAYHVSPITKIKVCFFRGSQYMSNLIPIKSSGNEFRWICHRIMWQWNCRRSGVVVSMRESSNINSRTPSPDEKALREISQQLVGLLVAHLCENASDTNVLF